MLSHMFATCLMIAASSYQVPPAVLFGIHQVEGGKVGQAVGPNKNGSYDLGPMQINTLWVPVLAKHWDISKRQAHHLIKNDACTNANVAAWILKSNLDETKSLSKAIAYYHSRTPSIGYRYRKKVIAAMRKAGLVKSGSATQKPKPSPHIMNAPATFIPARKPIQAKLKNAINYIEIDTQKLANLAIKE